MSIHTVTLRRTFETTGENETVTGSADLRITAVVYTHDGDVEMTKVEVEQTGGAWRVIPEPRREVVEQKESGAIVERDCMPNSLEEMSDQNLYRWAESWLDDNHAAAHEAAKAQVPA